MNDSTGTTERYGMADRARDRGAAWLSAAAIVPLLAGCITVKAPEKPIEINLNVNVRQEVVVKLQKDAGDFISNNPELFPQ